LGQDAILPKSLAREKSMTQKPDLAILGGGPGGYVAALRAAQLGAQVILIEENRVGGVCLNVGCIPTKALLRSAEVFRTLQQAGDFGLVLEGGVTPDWAAIQARKERIVTRLVRGVEFLLRKAGVQVLQGRGRFVAPKVLEVTGTAGPQRVEAQTIVLACGARPISPPLPGMDLPGVLDSTGALALEALPRRVLIVGGGAIGAEFADLFNAFGVEVTLVEMLSRLLPTMDADLGEALARILKARGVALHLESSLTRISAAEGGLRAVVATPEGDRELLADRILVAVGRQPNVEDLGLDVAGVRVEKTGIPVDAQMQTNVPGVYAIGDVTGGIQLAHVASLGGEVVAENAMGHASKLDIKTVPNAVYTSPEVAAVGLTEAQARQAGYEVRIGRFPLRANGKALTYGESDGFVKVISEAQFDEVLGLHIVAPHASDLVHEGGLALCLEVTLDEIAATVHGHPTLGEAIRESVLDARGAALHLPR
jgi:dihydrolipoamide dehydrogenase